MDKVAGKKRNYHNDLLFPGKRAFLPINLPYGLVCQILRWQDLCWFAWRPGWRQCQSSGSEARPV